VKGVAPENYLKGDENTQGSTALWQTTKQQQQQKKIKTFF